jgi:ABC-type amino acid transport system permease subunit
LPTWETLLRLDLGSSITDQGQNVWEVIRQYFPATVEVAAASMIVALIVGIGVGMLSASSHRNSFGFGGTPVWDYHLCTSRLLGGNDCAVNLFRAVKMVPHCWAFSYFNTLLPQAQPDFTQLIVC